MGSGEPSFEYSGGGKKVTYDLVKNGGAKPLITRYRQRYLTGKKITSSGLSEPKLFNA